MQTFDAFLEKKQEISVELALLLHLPEDLFDLFLTRFSEFKFLQTQSNFNALDDIALLIQDIREIVFQNQNIDKYKVEVALSALSQYCTDIDLLFLKNARDDTLFQSLRDSVVLEKEKLPKKESDTKRFTELFGISSSDKLSVPDRKHKPNFFGSWKKMLSQKHHTWSMNQGKILFYMQTMHKQKATKRHES